jgi:5-hydroxyisourate hydrolase
MSHNNSNTKSTERIKSITTHLNTTAMANRPFITCHVLDTTTGRPGAGIKVTLKLLSPQKASTGHWAATTNDDGRVPSWTSSASSEINEVVAQVKGSLKEGEQMVWSLNFETEAYYGKGKTFWPEVELRFAAKVDEEHYHVPLLLGPWSFTTYRGS